MDNTPQTETHPLFSTFQSFNGIEQISALFKSTKNIANKDLSSFCISFFQNKQVRKSAELAQIELDDAYKKVT
ncbi:MAG: hypothetical protein EZS28_032936 [Streblomastix strix]|uniref:Uncharacterized protein n=1 Tax=Streblomastix strix TaxID=222440 RepID=A0A5J4UMA4_9EUKA|nr:MAG: hypothetical protein EZS28_032936 [Streblomastix strix]